MLWNCPLLMDMGSVGEESVKVYPGKNNWGCEGAIYSDGKASRKTIFLGEIHFWTY